MDKEDPKKRRCCIQKSTCNALCIGKENFSFLELPIVVVAVVVEYANLWLCTYSARRLMGSRIIESAAYCNHILLAQLHKNSAQNTSVNCIIRLLLSLLCRPKVILLSGGHCTLKSLSSAFNDLLNFLKSKPLNVITLGRTKSDNINRTIAGCFYIVSFCTWDFEMWSH